MQVHEQLRLARETLGLDLTALEHRTRVRLHLLQALEAGRFGDLPRGVYARAVIRSYAGAVGVDPEKAVAEATPFLPGLEDPIDGLARVHGIARESPPEAAANTDGVPPERVPLRLPRGWPRVAAASVADTTILLVIFMLTASVTALACGLPFEKVLAMAAPALAAVCALIGMLYYLLLGGVRGNTPGTRMARALPSQDRSRGVTASDALSRACELAARQVSIVVDLLIARRNAA